MTIAAFRAQVVLSIQDDANIIRPGGTDYTTIDAKIQDAIAIYSKDKPRKFSKQIAGDGTKIYDLPAEWVEELSRIVEIEYPAGEDPPLIIAEETYSLYRDPTDGLKLRFLGYEPSTGENFNLFFLTTHTVSDTVSTVYDGDFYPVCNLASSYCLRTLAAHYAQTSESSIGADAVAYRDKSKQYTELAKELELKYNQAMGKHTEEEKTRKFASSTKDFDTNLIDGTPHLTHERRYR